MKGAIRALTCDNEASPRGAVNTAEGSDPPIRYDRRRAGVSLPSNEEWRPVPEYEGHYEVSNRGRVRSLHQARITVLRPSLYRGYEVVRLSKFGVRSHGSVHRLVALAFCDRPEGCDVVRHLDGSRRNNSPDNLAWGTHSDNAQDTLRHGTHQWASRSHCSKGHELSEQNTRYRNDRPGSRVCRICQAEHSRKKKAKKRLEHPSYPTNRPHKPSMCGYKGVSPKESGRRWKAAISTGQFTRQHLGTFGSPEEAARAYDAAAFARWGARAFLNFPAEYEGQREFGGQP